MKAIELYDDQKVAVEALRANFRTTIKRQVLCSATGSGKTVMGSHLMEEALNKSRRAIFIVDRINLVEQTSATLDKYGIPHGVIQAQHWRWQPHQRIQIASAQTLEQRGFPDDIDLIICDECHTTRKKITDWIVKSGIYAVGLSATPLTKGLGKIYEAVVSVTTTNKLIAANRLCNYEVYRAEEVDMKGVKVVAGEWEKEETAKRIIPIVGDVVAGYIKHGDDGKFMLFASSVSDCEEFQRQFSAAGIRTELVTWRTNGDEVKRILEEYPKPDSNIRGLITVSKLSKGFDAPCVKVLIMVRPLRKSLMEHIQIVGRLLRVDANDPAKVGKIFDHSGNWMRFYDETMDFFENSIHELDDGTVKKTAKAKPKERKPMDCPKCHIIHEPAPKCPNCGHEYKRKAEMVVIPGELVKIEDHKAVISRDEKQQLWSELRYVARERGYNPGWAAHKYKDKFGVWPRGLDDTEIEPSQKTMNWIRSQQIRYAKRRPLTAEEMKA